MVKSLHPEMTDLTEAEIVPLTLNPVILNGQYNDLALLVRDKLIIFVEAQSTWTINIIVRMLLYLAGTYHEYITDHEMNVYTSKKLAIPEPEFYVIYTGRHKIEKDIISLREDFWNNPEAKLDLQVRVIHAENKYDVIGQYIIFCHVLDGQIKIHGRKKIAAEETIRICQDAEVLKAYLEGRKKEVISIMKLLFDQEYAVKAYGREQAQLGEQRGAIQGTIETFQEVGKSASEVIHRITAKFGLTEKEAADYVHKFWRS